MIDLSIHPNIILGLDFSECGGDEVTTFLTTHYNEDYPYTVSIEHRSEQIIQEFRPSSDVIFGFDDPQIWWNRVIKEWRTHWYRIVVEPIEEWENEGGAIR